MPDSRSVTEIEGEFDVTFPPLISERGRLQYFGDQKQYRLPSTFTAQWRRKGMPTVDIDVAVVDGVPQLEQLRVTRTDRDVEATDLRAIPVQRLIAVATRRVLFITDADGTLQLFDGELVDQGDGTFLIRPVKRKGPAPRRPRRERKINDAHLRDVAEAWGRLEKHERNTQALAQALGATRRTTQRWITKAIEAGNAFPGYKKAEQ